ncbi:hypothetical protein EI534_05400 [Pseudomonas frederiksbergensis]|nr:hypothetical protein [Pseudomonas frederiksbergensis]
MPAIQCGSELWRGGLSERRIAPFECAALTRSLVYQRFWGCFATQRGQAPSPRFAPAGISASFPTKILGLCPAR